jgi:hypothetical protein
MLCHSAISARGICAVPAGGVLPDVRRLIALWRAGTAIDTNGQVEQLLQQMAGTI